MAPPQVTNAGDITLLSSDQPTSSSQSSSGIIEFRGRILDPDAWLEDVKKCRYLPESQMISLCNM